MNPEILLTQLVANHDSIIKQRLEDGPLNATYLSPDIQINLLQVMKDMISNSITEVNKAGYYSLLADIVKRYKQYRTNGRGG